MPRGWDFCCWIAASDCALSRCSSLSGKVGIEQDVAEQLERLGELARDGAQRDVGGVQSRAGTEPRAQRLGARGNLERIAGPGPVR